MKKRTTPSKITTIIIPIATLHRIDEISTHMTTSRTAVIRQIIAAGLPVIRAQLQFRYGMADESEKDARGT